MPLQILLRVRAKHQVKVAGKGVAKAKVGDRDKVKVRAAKATKSPKGRVRSERVAAEAASAPSLRAPTTSVAWSEPIFRVRLPGAISPNGPTACARRNNWSTIRFYASSWAMPSVAPRNCAAIIRTTPTLPSGAM